jgi:hypothetical protein
MQVREEKQLKDPYPQGEGVALSLVKHGYELRQTTRIIFF